MTMINLFMLFLMGLGWIVWAGIVFTMLLNAVTQLGITYYFKEREEHYKRICHIPDLSEFEADHERAN